MTKVVPLILFGMMLGAAATIAVHSYQPNEPRLEPSSHDESDRFACINDDAKPSLGALDKDSSDPEIHNQTTDQSKRSLLAAGKPRTEMSPDNGADTVEGRADRIRPDPTNLPDSYKYLVEREPASRRRLTPQENHAFFSRDTRDESWAYTMELGIKEYLAANQNAGGTVVEHVECRSRMCEIAGVVYPGGQDDFSEHLEVMSNSGWWQLSNSQHTTGGVVDGEYRFVSFIPRDSEDTLVSELASSICD